HRRVALGLPDQIGEGVSRPATAPVGRDPIAPGAPELVEGQAGGLADDVPEADVERGERVGRHALALDPPVEAEHAFPQPLDEEWVLAQEERREARLEIDLDRLGAAAAEGEAVAESAEALVGLDRRDDEPVLGELERDRLGRGDAEDEALDAGDLHQGTGPAPPAQAGFAKTSTPTWVATATAR